jgi:hypothetical protein
MKADAIAGGCGFADLGQLGECNCSICAKKGILHLPVRREDFELLSGADALTTYRFNTGVAEHTFCKFCGIYSYGVPRVRPDRITVNARCLDNVERAFLTPNRFFDGQDWEEAAKAVPRNPITGIAGCCARAARGRCAAEQGDELAPSHELSSGRSTV